MLSHAAQSGRHALSERGNDLYETPACAVEALLRVEELPHRIWEPAAGRGAIVKVLRDHGHAVIASDIIDYGFPLHFTSDFLVMTEMPPGTMAVVTNPPFKCAEQFVAHALDLCPRVVVLARLAFLESERRAAILDRGKLAHVHVFKRRLPFMHRAGWTGRRASSAIPFAWFVFDRGHRGPTVLDRISTGYMPPALGMSGKQTKAPKRRCGMIDGINIDRMRCECGQLLCELDVLTDADGAVIYCSNCGNLARLEEPRDEFEEFPLDPSGDNSPAAPAT